jgi:superfamily II DNA or RNA helicase
MSSEVSPQLARWSGIDSVVAKRVTEVSQQCIEAYRANPLLIREHANIERGTAEGGYGRRQLYELVQNGADQLLGASGRIEVILTHDALYCANEGSSIDLSGIEAVLCSHLSSKRGWEIGRFGLGFKSVLGITDSPEFYSRSGSFVFSKAMSRERISKVAASDRYPILRLGYPINPAEAATRDPLLEELMSWAATVVKLPILPETGGWLSDDLGNFPAEFVLFAGHVSRLTLDNRMAGKRRDIQCERDEEIVILDEGGNTSVWKVFSTTHRPTAEARKEAGELADRDELPLHWAVPVEGRMGRGQFWAFFPTQYETTLSGILNAPWKTNEDRQNLLPSRVNQELIDVAARLAVDSIPKLVKSNDPGWILDVFPGRLEESPQWADRILNTKIYQIAKTKHCIPDQFGEARLPTELNCTPGHLPASAYEQWAAVNPRPWNWPHPTAETRSRRARMERLFEPEVQPASIGDWLQALTVGGSAIHSIAALRVASAIWGADGPRLHRDEVIEAKIALTESGELVALDASNLFLVNPALIDKPVVPYIHAEVASDPVVLEFLRKIGIRDADISGELSSCIAHGIQKFTERDWQRFWSLAAAAGTSAIELLRSRTDVSSLRVRTVSGEFQPLRSVLAPGTIADPKRDPRVAVDMEYHSNTMDLLRALGVSEKPVAGRGSLDESWGYKYRAVALETYYKTLTTRQRPMESYLNFFHSQCAGPLEPFIKLSEEGKAYFTEELLGLNEPDWTFGHVSRSSSYPTIKFPAPSVWLVRNVGYLRTSLGVRNILQSVGRPLNRWSQFIPVVEPDIDASRLNLPAKLDQLSEAQWKGAFAEASMMKDEAALGDFYAEASAYQAQPEAIRCRSGGEFTSLPPNEVTVATHGSEREALAGAGQPFVFVRQAAGAASLIERWRLRSADLSVKTEVVSIPSGPENLLVKEFPPLRGCAPHIDEYLLVPCASLREETLTPVGKVGEYVDWHIEARRIYFVDSLSDSELLDRLSLHFSLDLSDDEKRDILEHRIQEDVQKSLAEIRLTEGAPAKLAKIVKNNETILRHLPRGLVEAVSLDGKGTDVLRLAELAYAVYGVDLFREFAGDMVAYGIDPPARWSGSPQAISFVASLGLGKEFAGFESSRRDPLLEVQGPPQLPSLHEFQEKILDRIKDMVLRKGPGRGILVLPTGAGKTRVAVQALVDCLVSNSLEGPLVWIAQSDELCEQAVQSWSECWRTFGDRRTLNISRLWGPNQAQGLDTGPQVVVATIDKMSNRVDDDLYQWLARCSCIVVDEAHGSINPEYTSVLRWLGLDISQREIKQDRCPLIGLTATPFRGHSEEETRRLVGRYGGYRIDKEVLGEDPYSTLQDKGVLALVDHRVVDGADIELTEGEQSDLKRFVRLPAAVEERLGTDRHRNQALLESVQSLDGELGGDWTAILFATSVDHARVMAALLNLGGIPSAAITAETDVGARRYYVEAFRKGNIRVLTNYGVLAQGFDAPSVRVIFVARPTFSPNLYQQMIGRGLRGPKNGGKERCLIINVRDNLDRYGVQLAFHHFDHLWRGRQ